MNKRKTLQDLTLKDNFLFGAVMIDDDSCKRFLELALEFPIAKVVVSKEKSIVYHPEFHGIRLDIYASDEHNTRYDVEMQVAEKSAICKRSRYYHSQMDMDLLLAGRYYTELPDMYVIFICDFDPFGMGKYRYTFQNICRESADLRLQDGASTIFLSTTGCNDSEVPAELVEFLHFAGSDNADTAALAATFTSPYVKYLSEKITQIKMNREMEGQFMLMEEWIQDERADAKAEGILLGKTEGILRILSLYGSVPDSLKQKIQNESKLSVLDFYLECAAKSSSIEEFTKLISSSAVV